MAARNTDFSLHGDLNLIVYVGAEVKWHAAVCLQLKPTYTCARMVFYPAELNQLGVSVQCLSQVSVANWILHKCSGICSTEKVG